ncbi:Rieske 2Fe-2S domain-containing protein [Streptomyces sp. INA 01156]
MWSGTPTRWRTRGLLHHRAARPADHRGAGPSGEVHAISNACRHRAGPVAVGEGNTRFGFSCLYHGWSYNHDGSGRSCSGMEDAEDFDAKALQLPKYDVRVWEKWVFAAPGGGAPDFDEWIETTAFRAARYSMDELEFTAPASMCSPSTGSSSTTPTMRPTTSPSCTPAW